MTTDNTRPCQLTDTELDEVYTHFCRTMTGLGEKSSALFMARFALLAMTTLGDKAAIERLIREAAQGLPLDAN